MPENQKRAKMSLSHYKLFSCDMGELVPCGLVEVLPGDTFQHATSALVRCAPLNAPVMTPVEVRIHHWYVPHRLVWEDWEDFITGGPDGMDASVFPTITFPANQPDVGTLADYLGVPTDIVAGIEVSALPFRGYQLIWKEWYRDQDLQTAPVIDLGSGADSTTSTALQYVGWEKDYFTSSRPWEQKGPAITIPIGDEAPVGAVEGGTFRPAKTGTVSTATSLLRRIDTSSGYTNDIAVVADLTSASAITINLLREAFALQRFEEARARYGSRYVEYLRYLGVRSSDARLQRPEYLGGGRQTIQFSEVLQTAEGTDPVGELRGHGLGALRSNRYRRYFEEHGYVFSFISVKPKTIYAQGIPRTWNRRTKEDFWQRELQHIGQQPVLYKEVYAPHATPDGTFGYQDRYDEYRRMESSIAGQFRTTELDFWHMARIFASDPALNATFVASNPTKRIFASQDDDGLFIQAKHSIQARRLVAPTGKSFIY